MNSIRQYLGGKMEPYERSTLQLLSIMVRDEGKEKIDSFPYNSKTYLTLKEKNMFPFTLKICSF